jgi:hypothetical protein
VKWSDAKKLDFFVPLPSWSRMSPISWILTVGMSQNLDLDRETGLKPWTWTMNLE